MEVNSTDSTFQKQLHGGRIILGVWFTELTAEFIMGAWTMPGLYTENTLPNRRTFDSMVQALPESSRERAGRKSEARSIDNLST